MKKYSVDFIKKSKNKEVLSAITAYDALFAKLFDGEVEIILVGDSLSMSFGGAKDTLSITLEQMIYHAQAVTQGAKESLIVLDLPFGSYSTPLDGLTSSIKAMKESAIDGVKIEGGREKAEVVKTLSQNGIAVLGHIGLKPQSVRSEGGWKIKGKSDDEIDALIEDAKAIQDAGAFAIVVEGVKDSVAEKITKSISIPTIGIGAGNSTDGQIIVWSDMLGFFEEFKPKFVRHYMDGASLVKEALKTYTKDVKNRDFPNADESY
ncbi:MAG: 3-methyl-2-oxobutanoate hydroxymethyltransferase [Campylobacterales bacterium]